MAVHDSPTPLRRLLGRRFRDMREARKETGAKVAKAVGISPSALSRFENGRRAPAPLYVRELCKYFSVDQSVVELLVEMAIEASRETGWWENYDKIPAAEASYISWESVATVIENFEVDFIPGLLQTREYSREIASKFYPEYSDKELRDTVDARITRKQILEKPSFAMFHAIVDEVVFERAVGGNVAMRDQLVSLLDSAQHPKITIQVIPKEVGAYRGMGGGFSIMGFSEREHPEGFAYAEGALAMVYQDDQIDVAEAKKTFRGLSGIAANPDDSIAIIRKRIANYNRTIDGG